MLQVAENDELPHKICFRCSAKLEELYEFILKCIKTQENLRNAIGKRVPVVSKSKIRVQWENQLNKKNISNDDICNALIKNAMEGIKNIPAYSLPLEEEKPQPSPTVPHLNKKINNGSVILKTVQNSKEPLLVSSKINISDESDDPDELNLKQVKLTIEKCDKKIPLTRSLRSIKSDVKPLAADAQIEPPNILKQYLSQRTPSKIVSPPVENKSTVSKTNETPKSSSANGANNILSNDIAKTKDPPPKVAETLPPPPINIMDHVSTIKVNKVGTLFLCRLCNRNFLKKEIVLTHGCAKNNVPKDKFLHSTPPPRDIPKPPVTVKYIKMDTDSKKIVAADPKPVVPEKKSVEKKSSPILSAKIPVQLESKPKPKAGPASKVKHNTRPILILDTPKEPTPPPATQPTQYENVFPAVQFPTKPSVNSRYKLVPGPNNTFTLVEDSTEQNQNQVSTAPPVLNNPAPKPKSKKRKIGNEILESSGRQGSPATLATKSNMEVIDIDDIDPPQPAVIEQPYPVGLFTTPHHSGVFAPNVPKQANSTTTTAKKHSYTIVQTGNPSKLLISTKPQPDVEEPHRKKSKKTKPDAVQENPQSKEAGYFTFINVDPLLQPSYVLPTDNIIQESQISTSTPASKALAETNEKHNYSCNMCEETFSREKKLLAHIQSHFNQMDEEDQLRKSVPKRKTRKS